MIMILVVVMYPYQLKRIPKFFLLDHLISHKFKEVRYFLTARKNAKCSFFSKQILITSAYVGNRLIFFLSVVGNFLLVLSVVCNIFRLLSLVG